MYSSFRIHIKSAAFSATAVWKSKIRKKPIPVASHATGYLHSVRKTYDKLIKEHSHAPRHKIRSFLLKTDWETHRPNGWWQHRSSHQQAYHYYDVMYQNSSWGHWEQKHKRSKKDKNSYVGYYCVRINTDVFVQNTTNSVVSLEKRTWYPIKIPRLFGFYVYTANKHM
jgi:hypothetical protein